MIQYKHSKTSGKLTKKQKRKKLCKGKTTRVKTFPSKLMMKDGRALATYSSLEIALPQLQFVLIISKSHAQDMLFASATAICRCCPSLSADRT